MLSLSSSLAARSIIIIYSAALNGSANVLIILVQCVHQICVCLCVHV